MQRIVLALVVGMGAALYAAAPAIADDATTAQPVVISGTPVVVTGTADVISTAPTTRRGLFGRLRDRRGGTTMGYAPMPATGTIVTPTPAPSITIPTPMPKPITVTPASGFSTATPMVTTAAYTTTSQPARTGLFGRMRNRTSTTTVPMTVVEPMLIPMSAVVPASGTVTMMPMTSSEMMMTSTMSSGRMGLLARMRARR